MDEEKQEQGRFSRWSKRKIAVANAEEKWDSGIEEIATENSPEIDAEREAELIANREAAEAIDLETMDENTDFTVFMKDGVPEFLKKQAMASLWRSNPVFANIDGLVDYDDDFGSPDLIMKTFKSAYQAGRGYLDLFKEKDEEAPESTPDEVAASNSGEETDEEAQSDDALKGPETENSIADASSDTPESAEAEPRTDEPEFIEEKPIQKVSLRRRLELEQSG